MENYPFIIVKKDYNMSDKIFLELEPGIICFLELGRITRDYREDYGREGIDQEIIAIMKEYKDCPSTPALLYASVIKRFAEGKLDSYLEEQMMAISEYLPDSELAHRLTHILINDRKLLRVLEPTDWLKSMEQKAIEAFDVMFMENDISGNYYYNEEDETYYRRK